MRKFNVYQIHINGTCSRIGPNRSFPLEHASALALGMALMDSDTYSLYAVVAGSEIVALQPNGNVTLAAKLVKRKPDGNAEVSTPHRRRRRCHQ